MTSRFRESRRPVRSAREPAIWRGPLTSTDVMERAPVQHSVRGRVFVSWRIFSGMIVLSFMLVLLIFFSADAFYVRSIAVGGLQYATKEEVFALSGIANMHVFWVDPQQVRADILRSPTIADATVTLGWPPQMVQVMVREREPALVWEQSGIATWIDLQGRVMRQREDRPDLMRVSVDSMIDGPPETDISLDIVNGVLQLRDLLPNTSALRYHPEKGLGYNDARGWEAWLGTGTNMPEKILVYNAVVSDLQTRGVTPGEVNVSDPDHPFYTVLAGR